MANPYRAPKSAKTDSFETHNTPEKKGRKFMKNKYKRFAPFALMFAIVALFAIAFSGTALADPMGDCIAKCGGGGPDAVSACIRACQAGGAKPPVPTTTSTTPGKTPPVTGGGCGDKIAVKSQCVEDCPDGQAYDLDESGKLTCTPCSADPCESATKQFKTLERQIKELKEQVAAIKPTCPPLQVPPAQAWYDGIGWLPWLLVLLLALICLVLAAKKGGPPKAKKTTQGGQPPQGGGNQFGAAP